MLRRKVVVFTGATSGIGLIAARKLAAAGLRLILIARDRERAQRVIAQLPGGADHKHRAHFADLSSLTEVRRAADEIAAREPRIDVLINNAGNIYGTYRLTADGLERTFATNHATPFLLTKLLREPLLAAAPSRIVVTASEAHRNKSLCFADLQMSRRYAGLDAYGRSKLCNILFTRELARRLAGTGVTANCLHPGFVRTGLGQRHATLLGLGVKFAMLFAGRPERGADTIVYLATALALEHATGGYYYDCQPRTPDPAALDDASAERLWEATEKLTSTRLCEGA
jgi:NAD(P)-dependent dehydrogenase (short-subunit alcohol dehydrogenase family)